MLKINLKVIKYKPGPNSATGYWFIDKKGVLQIRVADFGNLDYIKLHIIHEIFEAFACTRNKNAALDVREMFDKRFLKWAKEERSNGREPGIDEVGFHPDCPYHDEHMAATGVEMILANLLGVKWAHYEDRVREVSCRLKTPIQAQFNKRRKTKCQEKKTTQA